MIALIPAFVNLKTSFQIIIYLLHKFNSHFRVLLSQFTIIFPIYLAKSIIKVIYLVIFEWTIRFFCSMIYELKCYVIPYNVDPNRGNTIWRITQRGELLVSHSFFGGVHPDDCKRFSNTKAIEVLNAPSQVVIPMSLHIGAPCQPLVSKGDKVLLGQKIGDSQAPVSAPIHSSVSGTVIAVEPHLHPNGTKVMSVVIENDGLDTPSPEMISHESENLDDPQTLIKIIREAGIVGMGGATFPTAFKISSGAGKVDTVIINGAECEPYITSDHRIMLEKPEDVIAGIRLIVKACGLEKAYVGIEANKMDAVNKLRELTAGSNNIEIMALRTRYPQGAEKQLIQTITGRQVPPGGLPAAVGCAVFNVFTAYSVYRAVHEGFPAIERIVTVSGSAVNEPKNLRVRVGTPIEYVFEAAGGFKKDPFKVLMGGPMMGNAQASLDVPVLKGTNALLAFCEDEEKTVSDPVCIRCGRCVAACPMHLLPLYLYMYERKSDMAALEKYHVTDCIECGACTYGCPGRLHLTQSCRTGKAKLAAHKAKEKALAEAAEKAKAEAEPAKA